jgi:hypothetical protein
MKYLLVQGANFDEISLRDVVEPTAINVVLLGVVEPWAPKRKLRTMEVWSEVLIVIKISVH